MKNSEWALWATIFIFLTVGVIVAIIALIDFIRTHIVLCSLIFTVIIIGIIYYFNRFRINTFIKNILMPKPDSPPDIDKPQNNGKAPRKTP